MQALRAGREWDEASRLEWWAAYYAWLEPRLFYPGRWAIIPDSPGAPSQINDGLLNDWPYGHKGAPVWHMDQDLGRLGRLCERYSRVCIGWIGDPKKHPVGCPEFRDRMEEVGVFLGNQPPPIHLLRGTLVAQEYDFVATADSTGLAQNGHRYDNPIDAMLGDPWRGRNAYADRLESGHFPRRLLADRRDQEGARGAPRTGSVDERGARQLGLW